MPWTFLFHQSLPNLTLVLLLNTKTGNGLTSQHPLINSLWCLSTPFPSKFSLTPTFFTSFNIPPTLFPPFTPFHSTIDGHNFEDPDITSNVPWLPKQNVVHLFNSHAFQIVFLPLSTFSCLSFAEPLESNDSLTCSEVCRTGYPLFFGEREQQRPKPSWSWKSRHSFPTTAIVNDSSESSRNPVHVCSDRNNVTIHSSKNLQLSKSSDFELSGGVGRPVKMLFCTAVWLSVLEVLSLIEPGCPMELSSSSQSESPSASKDSTQNAHNFYVLRCTRGDRYWWG